MRTVVLSLASFVVAVVLCAGPAVGARRPPPAPGPPPQCLDHDPIRYVPVTVITTVQPAANYKWSFSDAPAVLAQYLLKDLNNNALGITFSEASGAAPNFRFNVTMLETNQGTQQDTASLVVWGPPNMNYGSGPSVQLWLENSGPSPYVGWRSAIDALAVRMLGWFQNGWKSPGRCTLPNGLIREHYP
jgi:hypothetical protein